MTCKHCGRPMEGFVFVWPNLRPAPDVEGWWFHCDTCHSNYFAAKSGGELEEVVCKAAEGDRR